MILFLNFAPIRFMGGAERWMNDTAKKINEHEETYVASVSPRIANIYSNLVLKRHFEDRVTKNSLHNNIILDAATFIPFTNKWKKIKKYFKESRIIYAKYELLEVLIILYFLGFTGLRKTIAGLHSSLLYNAPDSFFEKLHNSLYGSKLNTKILSMTKKIHVLNKRDFRMLTDGFKLKKVLYIPNGINSGKEKVINRKTDTNILKILFVGDLSKRKGCEILIKIIEKSPDYFEFTIAGDGPLKLAIQSVTKTKSNSLYKGFVKKNELERIYERNDVLMLPSRAEGMSLAVLEALSHGLIIVNSKETSLDLKKEIEFSLKTNTPEGYLDVLNKIFHLKQSKKINRTLITSYFNKNFSSEVIDPILYENIFAII